LAGEILIPRVERSYLISQGSEVAIVDDEPRGDAWALDSALTID